MWHLIKAYTENNVNWFEVKVSTAQADWLETINSPEWHYCDTIHPRIHVAMSQELYFQFCIGQCAT